MKALLKLLILVLLSSQVQAQRQEQIDSLKQKLSASPTDSGKIEVLNKLSYALVTIDAKSAFQYAKQSILLARKTGFKKGLAHAYNNLGILFDQQGESDSAMWYYNRCLEMSKQIRNAYLEASALSNIGYISWTQGNYKKALDYTLKGLAILDTGSNYIATANCLEHVGMIYYDLKQFPNSIDYHRRALAIYERNKSEEGQANVYCNLALDYYPAQKDSMIYYLKKAELIFLRQDNHWGLGHVYNNIGGLYLEMKNNDQALFYLRKARNEHDIVDDERGMCSTHISIGMAWLWKDRTALAKSHVDTAIAMATRMKQDELLAEAYRSYGLIYSKLGQLDSVEKYLDKESAIKDTLFNSDKTRALADIQTKYDTEKKDLELAKNKTELRLKAEESQQKNTIILSIVILSVLLVITGVSFYRRKQIQQKAWLDAQIAAQKESKAKAIIEAEEKERIRIATDLHDGVGQLLSAAKLNLSSLENKLKLSDAEQENAFKNALGLVDDSVKEVRTVSHNMMPNTLLKLGLASAVKEFITKIQGTPNLKVNLEIVGLTERLEQEKETVVYRVIQEVVSNIIKHAKATELTLQLIKHEKELSILIEDNGVGFDTSKINEFEGIGLKNILSRVEFINGTVHFDSAPNRGTTVVIELAT